MKRILIGIVAIVVFMYIFSEVTGHITNSRIQKRITYWKSLIDTEVPIGTVREKVEQWGRQRHLGLGWIDSKKFFDANVEQIPNVGIGVPCSAWNIIIDIYMGNDGRSIRREVHSVGSCF